jgi:hypothetical protein
MPNVRHERRQKGAALFDVRSMEGLGRIAMLCTSFNNPTNTWPFRPVANCHDVFGFELVEECLLGKANHRSAPLVWNGELVGDNVVHPVIVALLALKDLASCVLTPPAQNVPNERSIEQPPRHARCEKAVHERGRLVTHGYAA